MWKLFDHHFDEFEYRYDDLFSREFGFSRPVIQVMFIHVVHTCSAVGRCKVLKKNMSFLMHFRRQIYIFCLVITKYYTLFSRL